MGVGIRVKHSTLRSCVALVPVLQKPYTDGGFQCPTCRTLHPVKTVHLWLDDTGTCLVSQGVLDELRMAGMPDLEVVGHTTTPPRLVVGRGSNRAQIDHSNRKITQWASAR